MALSQPQVALATPFMMLSPFLKNKQDGLHPCQHEGRRSDQTGASTLDLTIEFFIHSPLSKNRKLARTITGPEPDT